MSKVYAIIPARGGSKGIPNKNLSMLNGRSLIEIGVNACLGANIVDKVFVSTDDSNIMAEAERVGAEIIVRPAHIAGDTSSSEEALLHALGEIEKQGYERPSSTLFYQITNALTNSEDIDKGYDYFIKSGADSMFTAALFARSLWERKSGKIFAINHDPTKRLMRQEVSNCFLENGAFYLMNTDGFLKSKHRFFGNIEMFEMEPINSHDIDEPIDLDIAEVLLKVR